MIRAARHAAVLLALAAAPLAAQTALVPVGSPDVRTAHLADRVDSLAVVVDRVQPYPVGSLVLQTVLVQDAGRDAVLRVETLSDTAGTVAGVDSFTVLRASLAPLAYASRVGQKARSIRFEGVRVRGEEVTRGVRKAVDVALPSLLFDGGTMDILLGALPLREGYAARLPVYHVDRAAAASASVQVLGAERVRTMDGGSCLAWRIAVAGGPSPGTYWIEERTRALVRHEGTGSPVRLVRRHGCADAPLPQASR
ncbi:MAG TPA: hypothetical protein VHG91_21230 [Longimicrobium sp.]|nr:hypothetical protein [Longimicrobium sp.]